MSGELSSLLGTQNDFTVEGPVAAYFSHDIRGRCTQYSDVAIKDLLGLVSEQLLGKTVEEHELTVNVGDDDRFDDILQDVLDKLLRRLFEAEDELIPVQGLERGRAVGICADPGRVPRAV